MVAEPPAMAAIQMESCWSVSSLAWVDVPEGSGSRPSEVISTGLGTNSEFLDGSAVNGATVGCKEGLCEGASLGTTEGEGEGPALGLGEGALDGFFVVGESVGRLVGVVVWWLCDGAGVAAVVLVVGGTVGDAV